jgi:alkanesulfonate monooxygenase SsuD/methylene tetrahydromethanopterin reductase-like flavin-dependent oxidoreductase (luciferase family)
MSFGISLQTSPPVSVLGGADALTFVAARAREAEAAGVDDIWLNQGLDIDAITVAALVASRVPRIIVGTAAVPMYPRHPGTLASQAKAAQVAAQGRLTLGIGRGHQAQVESVLGVPFDRRPVLLNERIRRAAMSRRPSRWVPTQYFWSARCRTAARGRMQATKAS